MKRLEEDKTSKKIFFYLGKKWSNNNGTTNDIPGEELVLEPRYLFQFLCTGRIAPQANVVEFKTYHTTSTRKIRIPHLMFSKYWMEEDLSTFPPFPPNVKSKALSSSSPATKNLY
jgi:hypothetical protein